WGDWSEVLKRNAGAIQIGLTATPRQLAGEAGGEEAAVDRQITADNIEYFGEPVYEYDMAQGIEDGYLAACEIVRRDIFLEAHDAAERETGIDAAELAGKRLADARTGELLLAAEDRAHYDARSFERHLEMPDRVAAMVDDLFDHLCRTGGPEQKTIVFCASDRHADDVANALNNRYAA
ncbi:MAG TPA: hypothetical protein VFQ80_03510, partial [Thermomicrobiales bacterium]|nr:hypothetical protein [Thermomicrobiales bacterium]